MDLLDTLAAPSMHVISGKVIREILDLHSGDLVDIVSRTYAAHEAKRTVNPDSYFLRYSDISPNRIIALPAAIMSDETDVSGIKWIASFPDNIQFGLARASAVLVLNDNQTGYPYAFMEAATISAVRTAASAVLAANTLYLGSPDRKLCSLSVIGSGIIAKHVLEQFAANKWNVDKLLLHDVNENSAQGLLSRMRKERSFRNVYCSGLAPALEADIVVFATNSTKPYLSQDFRFRRDQLILNISLRDLQPQQVIMAQNIFDDVEHCLKANTSPHLAELSSGGRKFVTGTITEVIQGKVSVTENAPIIYSPFGMGILDLAVGNHVYLLAKASGMIEEIPGFFGEYQRWTE